MVTTWDKGWPQTARGCRLDSRELAREGGSGRALQRLDAYVVLCGVPTVEDDQEDLQLHEAGEQQFSERGSVVQELPAEGDEATSQGARRSLPSNWKKKHTVMNTETLTRKHTNMAGIYSLTNLRIATLEIL